MPHPTLLALLGREPQVSIAELESVYGQKNILKTSDQAAQLSLSPSVVDINKLGGTIKFAEIVDILEETDWQSISKYVAKRALPEEFFDVSNTSKKRLGISVYGVNIPIRSVTGLGLELKKKFRKQGWSIGVVPNKTSELSSAKVLHNKLTDPQKGRELIILVEDNQTTIALTTQVQDIDAYTARDQTRPKRDAYVGMLPPKLAQIIINLAQPGVNQIVLDPFCGSGVLLQEALLMNYEAYGSDISPRMVNFATENLEWLAQQHGNLPAWKIEKADAQDYSWHPPADVVATEMYLGEPQDSQPNSSQLHKLKSENKTLLNNFLKNLHPQLATGASLCIAVPAWRRGNKFETALSVDDLKRLQYNQASFKHVDSAELIYARPDQVVGRKLLVLTRM